jgi:D-alanyl-D-alanine carboxypeptidase/D-alanyl-D-alanine-endopeptidase (penicillin-binding protein 4)
MQYLPGTRIAALLAGLCACLPTLAQLPAAVAERLSAAKIPPEAMGAIVLKARTGETVLAHRAAESMQPASTMKPLTAIVALERLGPAWRGRTELVTRAPIANGVLQGDLVLRGGADADFDWVALQRMLLVLRNKGVREVAGDFVLDRSLFDPARTDIGAPPFDESPEFRYNVIPDALPIDMNLVGLELESDGSAMRASLQPALGGVRVDTAMSLDDRACDKWEDRWEPPAVEHASNGEIRIRLKGSFPKNCSASTRVNVIERTAYADRLFRTLWHELGGTFRGTTRDAPMPGGRLIAEHQSRALGELARDINKRSDNPIARLVFLVLGTLDALPPGGTTGERAGQVVRGWLKANGIDDTGLVLDNGSGLSRKERIRPEQLARVLQAARTSLWAPEFVSSLPIVGTDGGMRKRLKDTPSAQRSRIKTGTLRDVSAVAGYVDDAAGETYIVVAMINHPLATASVARPILDALIDSVGKLGTVPNLLAPEK